MRSLYGLGVRSIIAACALALCCEAAIAQRYTITYLGRINTPNSGSNEAMAINDAGQVVGNCIGHGFLWRRGQMIDLGEGRAFGINSSGKIVGDSNGHAVLLSGNVATHISAGAIAYAVNDAGNVAGNVY